MNITRKGIEVATLNSSSGMISQVLALLKKDFVIEARKKYVLGGIILYTVSAFFIYYLIVKKTDDLQVWNALTWITILFGSVNAAAQSILRDNDKVHFYFYSLANPQAIIISRIIYNALLVFILSVICIFVAMVWLGTALISPILFAITVFLGGAGMAALLTFTSSISAKASGQPVLAAVLSFPLILPLITTLAKTTNGIFLGSGPAELFDELLILFSLDLIILALAYILFPYLWKD